MLGVWSLEDIHARVVIALREREELLRVEQAVRGMDGMQEEGLQQVLAARLREDGFGVFREVPYPMAAMASAQMQSSRRGKSGRERCDIVLTTSPHVGVRDEVWPPPMAERAKPTPTEAQLSLFTKHESQSAKDAAMRDAQQRDSTRRKLGDAASMPELVAPHEACWLELKVVGQFGIVDGFAGPNAAYGSLLTSACVSDIKKLSALGHLARWSATGLEAPTAGLVLVMFTLDGATAEHDLPVALHKAMDRGAIFRSPIIERFAMVDRIGNGCCSVIVLGSVPEMEGAR